MGKKLFSVSTQFTFVSGRRLRQLNLGIGHEPYMSPTLLFPGN